MARSPDSISDATLRLLLASGVGPATLRKLRAHFGSDDAIVGASTTSISHIDGIERKTAESLRAAIDKADVESERCLMKESDVMLIMLGDADYPALLATIDDAPTALWIRGQLLPQDRLSIAIVGSRRCTPYGREQSSRFATLLSQSGLTIVSGGALGIDGEAHRGALRNGGRTIVVMGCGLLHAYPPEHTDLFDRAVKTSGCVVSELPMRSPPNAGHFPRRNRIISGLSLGVLVIEAAMRSGALITARLAAEEHHREVMALPGRVDSPASAGCLRAIKEGWASLVLDHADVLAQLDGCSTMLRGALEVAGHDEARSAASLFDGALSPAQRAITSVLMEADQSLSIDQIVAHTKLAFSQVMADVTLMEIQRRIRREGGGFRVVESQRTAQE